MKKHKVISLAIVMSLLALPVITLTEQSDEKVAAATVVKQKKAKKENMSKKDGMSKKAHPAHKEKAEKKEMRHDQMHKETGKGEMHKIERELDKIKKSFKATGDVKAAERKLKTIPAQIKKAAACMQKGEEHGTMWKRHEHRLKEQLQEVRDIVNGKRNA